MSAEMGLFEAIYTTRSIRALKPDPVSDELVRRILEAACQAPSGSNSQPWRFVVIRSPEGKRQLDELVFQAEQRRAGEQGVSAGRQSLADVPVIILVCADRAKSSWPPSVVGIFGQTFPAVQNLLLAARAFGLGGNMTTSYKWMDAEIKAHLGVPEDMDTVVMVPLGYPDESRGARHGKKRRLPLEEIAYEERWGGPLQF